jgi:hypothetical protein
MPVFRIAAPVASTLPDLGFLADLPGTWVGNGFNVVSLPDFQHGQPFQVKVQETMEQLAFHTIGSKVPNRGGIAADIFYLGLDYLQTVSDALTHEALHIEPGFWLNMPPTNPAVDPTQPENRLLVRQASIPHGDALVALSSGLFHLNTVPTPANPNPNDPQFQNGTTVPIPTGLPAPALALFQAAQAALPPFPPIANDAVTTPDHVLRDQLAALKAAGNVIVDNKVIIISTDQPDGFTGLPGGIVNVPFILQNANPTTMSAIFWIETFRPAAGSPNGDDDFLVLQYSQRVTLRFPLNNPAQFVDWPHISVATLFKQ